MTRPGRIACFRKSFVRLEVKPLPPDQSMVDTGPPAGDSDRPDPNLFQTYDGPRQTPFTRLVEWFQ